jgi:hypothetical protein
MNAITVLIAGPDKLAGALKSNLKDWASKDLLRPFVWADAGRLNDEGAHVEQLPGELIEGGTSTEGRLRDILARQNVDVVRLVAVNLIEERGGREAGLKPATERLERDLNEALASTTQELVTINLLVPTSDCREIRLAALEPTWGANVMVSPEERLSPNHSDAGVLGAADLVVHATLVTASAGGLWFTMEKGPFDDRRLSQSGEGRLVVLRNFARLLGTSSIASEVTDGIFNGRSGSQWSAVAVGGVPALDPPSVAARLASEFVTAHGFTFKEAQPKPNPEKPRVNYLEAFGEMFGYMTSLWKMRVEDLMERYGPKGLEALVEKLTRIPEEQRDLSGADRKPETDEADTTRSVAALVLNQMSVAVTPPSAGETWNALRAVCFGSVDAGPFPQGISEPRDGAHRQILVNLNFASPAPDVPPPDLPIEGLGGLSRAISNLRSCDPLQAEALRLRLQEELSSLEADAEGGPDDVEPEAREAQEESTETEAKKTAAATKKLSRARVRKVSPKKPDKKEQLQLALTGLDGWIKQREASIVWRIGSSLGGALHQSRDSFSRHFTRVQNGVPTGNPAAGEEAISRLRLWWKIWGLVVILGILWGAGVQWPGGWTYAWLVSPDIHVSGIVVIALSLLLWFVSWTLVFIRFKRRIAWWRHQQDLGMRSYMNELEAAKSDAEELHRLSSLYIQFRDWAEIIGWLIHRPEGAAVAVDEEASADLRLKAPLGFQRASAKSSPEKIQAAIANAGKKSFSKGWLSSLYSSYLESAMKDLMLSLGMDSASGDIDPDRDQHTGQARPFLLDQISGGRYAPRWRGELHSKVLEYLSSVKADDLFDQLNSVGDGSGSTGTRSLNGATPSSFLRDLMPTSDNGVAGCFSNSLFTTDATIGRGAEITEIHIWLSGSKGEKAHLPSLILHPASPSASSGEFLLSALRLDLSGTHGWQQLKIFDPKSGGSPIVDRDEGIDIGVG